MAELAYLSLGSNLGDREVNLRRAIAELEKVATLCAISSFYETQPIGPLNQPWFLNCVVGLETEKSPRELLAAVLDIEAGMGRARMQDKGPRNIDIDILLFGDRIVSEPRLKIPHPAMHERRFVLEPLTEVAPDVCHPRLQKTVTELLQKLGEGQIVQRI